MSGSFFLLVPKCYAPKFLLQRVLCFIYICRYMFMVLKLRRHIPTNTHTHTQEDTHTHSQAHTRTHTFTHALIFTDQTRSASINKSCKQQIEQSQNNFWASKQMYGCIHLDVMELILKTFCRWLCLSKKTINQNAVGRISWLEMCRINLNEWFLLLLQKNTIGRWAPIKDR